MSLLYFIIAGLVLYIGLKFGTRVLEAIPVKRAHKMEAIRWFPMFEVIAWVAYAFWGSYVLFGQIRHYDLLLLIMAIFLFFGIAWFFFRDFFAGMMIKSDYKLKPGQYVKTPVADGIVVRLGSRFIELENDKGEKIKLPFSQLGKQWISLPADMEKSLSNHLVMVLPGHVDVGALTSLIDAEMMGMPWIIGTPPALKIKNDESGQKVLDIRFDLIKEEHNLLVENKIREIVGRFEKTTG